MVGTLLVIGIIIGFALFQYIKGGIIKGFIFLMAVILGIAAAFGFYEMLAGYIKDFGFIGAKAYPIAFFIAFVFVFVLVKEFSDYILKPEIAFGAADKLAGAVIGVVVGYLFSGAILVVIGLTPYKADWLYQRFEEKIANPPQASGVLLNPDGFVTGLFGTISGGSLKGQNSFAVVHADYINQIFLNRHNVSDGVWPIAAEGAVSLTPPGVYAAPENLMEAGQTPQPFSPEAGKTLTLVKLQINAMSFTPEDSESDFLPKFNLGQLRLIVKDKQDAGETASGSGEAVYPIGYINPAGQLVAASLDSVIGDEQIKGETAFAFYVPTNTAPVLMEFRHNVIEEIRPMAAPAIQPSVDTQPIEQSPSEPNMEVPIE